MADELKNVRRIMAVDETTLEGEISERMLGVAISEKTLGAKLPSSDMVWFDDQTAVDAKVATKVSSVVGGDGVDVDATDSQNPIVSIDPAELAKKRNIVHGFVDPDGMLFAFDDVTRVFTYSHPSGTVEFWAGGIFYSFANGSAQLTRVATDATQTCWLYFDIDGYLKCKTTLDWADVKSVCLGHLAKYDTDSDIFILTVARWEDCQANHVENFASYRSKGVQAVKGEGIGFDGVVGDTQTGYNAASYFSARDFEFSVPSLNFDAISWLRYHYDGFDDVGQYRIKLSVSPAPTGTPIIIGTDIGLVGTNAIYNIYTEGTDTFTVAECPSNDFVIGHLGVADGGSQKVVSLAPQGKYSTLNDAVEAMETEVAKLTGDDAIFRDVAITTSFIVKGNLAGGFLPVDAAGNAFYYHSISAQGGGGTGANNQSYDDVLGIDPSTDKDAIHTDGVTTTTISESSVVIATSSVSNTLTPSSSTIAIPTESVKITPDGITKADLGAGAGSPLAIVNSSTSQPDINITTSGSGDINLTTTGGATNIDSPTTTQSAADNATAGGLDDSTLMSYGGAVEKGVVTLTAGANVSGINNSSKYNSTCVYLGRGFTSTASITTGTIFTVEAGYRPDDFVYITLTETTTYDRYTISISTAGVATLLGASLPAGAYRFSKTYLR